MNRGWERRIAEIIHRCRCETGCDPDAIHLSAEAHAIMCEQLRVPNYDGMRVNGVPILRHQIIYLAQPPAWWRTPERDRPFRRTNAQEA